MKFTSEDLLKAMGLKLGDEVAYLDRKGIVFMGLNDIPMIDIEHIGKRYLDVLLKYDYTIIQPKPTLTEDEKVILRNLNKRYKYINREEYGGLRVSETKPIYSKSMKEYYYSGFDTFIYDNLFQFIKWEDEPYSIEELLKE